MRLLLHRQNDCRSAECFLAITNLDTALAPFYGTAEADFGDILNANGPRIAPDHGRFLNVLQRNTLTVNSDQAFVCGTLHDAAAGNDVRFFRRFDQLLQGNILSGQPLRRGENLILFQRAAHHCDLRNAIHGQQPIADRKFRQSA